MAAAAIGRSDCLADHEAMMVRFFLACSGLVTVQAGDILCGMCADFKFMQNQMLQPRRALGAFTGGANERDVGLIGFDFRPLAVNEKPRQHEAEANDKRDENGAE